MKTSSHSKVDKKARVSIPLYQAKAEFLRTLGHPARIRILELLSERDHAVHELLEQIAIEPSNLSQQLAVLRRTALVVSRRQDGEVLYSISVPEVRDFLLTARRILTSLAAAQGDLEPELTPVSAKSAR
jgi:ArsR family transcriptional regulator